ncbi:hypothetical protein ACIPY0_12315 [Paenarthrobacter nicotinovorans]|uniref:hypothetical protein n=1 Tax=Paenarthrobacter nicotinovorans TaxID=29320 RepID=UPI0037F2ABCE
MPLTLVHSRHDLPPFWDGEKVIWDEWTDCRTTLILHVPADQMACDKCGAVDESLIAWGLRDPAHGAMTTETRIKKTRSGKTYEAIQEVPARPQRDIYAARCRHCGHDVVTDTRTDERWDLEPEDYGAEGSYEHKDTLF